MYLAYAMYSVVFLCGFNEFSCFWTNRIQTHCVISFIGIFQLCKLLKNFQVQILFFEQNILESNTKIRFFNLTFIGINNKLQF